MSLQSIFLRYDFPSKAACLVLEDTMVHGPKSTEGTRRHCKGRTSQEEGEFAGAHITVPQATTR